MFKGLSNAVTAILAVVIVVIATGNFIAFLPRLYHSPINLFLSAEKPEEYLAKLFGPPFQVLYYLSLNIPDESIVCLPESYYKSVFEREDTYFQYFWLNREAFMEGYLYCQYKVELSVSPTNNRINVNIVKLN